MKNSRSLSTTEMTKYQLFEMTKTWKPQQKVSGISQLTFWPFCTYWRITKTDEWGKKSKSQITQKNLQAQPTEFLAWWTSDETEERNGVLKSMKTHKNLKNGVKTTRITVLTKCTQLSYSKWRILGNWLWKPQRLANWNSDLWSILQKAQKSDLRREKQHYEKTH